MTLLRALAIPMVVAALLGAGLAFLGLGVTGNVTSQSCCLPPNCAVEYLCTAGRAQTLQDTAAFDIRLGMLFMVAAGAVFIAHELSEPR